MAVTFTNQGASTTPDINSNVAGTSFVTASWTPPSSGLIIVDICTDQASGFPSAPAVSGNGITWYPIASVAFSFTRRLSRYGADASGSTAGSTTFGTFGGASQLSCRASFYSAAGTDVVNGVEQTFVQSPTNSGSGTSGSISLSAAGDSANRPIAAFHHLVDNEAKTPRTNWTGLDDLHNYNTMALATEYRGDAFETTASATWTSNVGWAGIASEIKALANVNAATTPSTVTAVGAVPTTTVTATASTAPSTVAAVAAIPTPSFVITAVATTTTVAATAAIPTPSIAAGGNFNLTTDTVAAVAAVPTPTVVSTAAVTTTTVAAIADIPTPSTVTPTLKLIRRQPIVRSKALSRSYRW